MRGITPLTKHPGNARYCPVYQSIQAMWGAQNAERSEVWGRWSDSVLVWGRTSLHGTNELEVKVCGVEPWYATGEG
jgi:hypothetical protein